MNNQYNINPADKIDPVRDQDPVRRAVVDLYFGYRAQKNESKPSKDITIPVNKGYTGYGKP